MTETVIGWLLQTPGALEALANPDCGWRYSSSPSKFSYLPGIVIAYWIGEGMVKAFKTLKPLGETMTARDGMHTCDNETFLRRWWEISLSDTHYSCTSNEMASSSKKTWFPYNKGGMFRKWEGNDEYVVNWRNDGFDIKQNFDKSGKLKAHGFNGSWGFRPSLTWSSISSGRIAIRNKPEGFMFDAAGYSMFSNANEDMRYIQAFCNSEVAYKMLEFLSPTLNYQAGDILSMPYDESALIDKDKIAKAVDECRIDTRTDWDSTETSWNFGKHPLI